MNSTSQPDSAFKKLFGRFYVKIRKANEDQPTHEFSVDWGHIRNVGGEQLVEVFKDDWSLSIRISSTGTDNDYKVIRTDVKGPITSTGAGGSVLDFDFSEVHAKCASYSCDVYSDGTERVVEGDFDFMVDRN